MTERLMQRAGTPHIGTSRRHHYHVIMTSVAAAPLEAAQAASGAPEKAKPSCVWREPLVEAPAGFRISWLLALLHLALLFLMSILCTNHLFICHSVPSYYSKSCVSLVPQASHFRYIFAHFSRTSNISYFTFLGLGLCSLTCLYTCSITH